MTNSPLVIPNSAGDLSNRSSIRRNRLKSPGGRSFTEVICVQVLTFADRYKAWVEKQPSYGFSMQHAVHFVGAREGTQGVLKRPQITDFTTSTISESGFNGCFVSTKSS